VEDVRTVLDYYRSEDDVIEAFKRNQARLREQQEILSQKQKEQGGQWGGLFGRKLFGQSTQVLLQMLRAGLTFRGARGIIGSSRSTTRPARRRAFKTKKFGVSTNNSIICFIAMQTYKELTKKFVMQDKNCQ
jgi:hypothetical protein